MPAFWAAQRCGALGLLEHVAHQPGGVGGEDEHVYPGHGRAHIAAEADQVAQQTYKLQAHDRLNARVTCFPRHDQLRDGDDHDERHATQPGPELEPLTHPKLEAHSQYCVVRIAEMPT